MPISKSDLRFYLTSVEPNLEQTNYSQSVGGYSAYVSSDASASLVCPRTVTASVTSRFDTSLTLTQTSEFVGLAVVGIDGEIMEIEPLVGSSGDATATIEQRAINDRRKMHASGAIAHGLDFGSLFNDSFNLEFKQYRCLALKNISETETAYDVKIYLRQNSRNIGNRFKLALEIPKNSYHESTADSGSSKTIIVDSDASVALLEDNYFANAMVRFLSGANSGQTRIALSFDALTRSIVLDSSLPVTPSVGDSFEIEPGPCSRMRSGLEKPSLAFSDASVKMPLSIDIDDRENGANLLPQDVVYVWIERSLGRKTSAMTNNNIVITVNYKTSA